MQGVGKILFVDDDEFVLEMYALKFGQLGFTVEFARNGEEAMKKLNQETYRLIISDIVMPRVNGFDLLEALAKKGQEKKTPVLVLTNLGEEEGREKCMALGATDYFLKAFYTPTEIVEKVKSILSKTN